MGDRLTLTLPIMIVEQYMFTATCGITYQALSPLLEARCMFRGQHSCVFCIFFHSTLLVKVPSYADKDNWHNIYGTFLHKIHDCFLYDGCDDLVERLSIINARERGVGNFLGQELAQWDPTTTHLILQ